MSLETDGVSSIRNNLLQDSSHKGQLDRFFEYTMKNFEHARLQNVGDRKFFRININVDDNNDWISHNFSFGHPHEHFPIIFFQSLCLKNDGYTVPIEIRNALMELSEIAVRNTVDELELVTYAIQDNKDSE